MGVCRIALESTGRWRAIAAQLAFTFLFVCSADAGQLTVAWTANTESDLAGYKLYYGTSSHSYQTSIDVGNRTTYIVTGLLAGQTYYFAVTAYNTSGAQSGYSNETSGVVGGGMPAGLVAAYAFDEGAGTTASDASGTGNTGTISGATWTVNGKFGQALSFNGLSSLVTVPDAVSLDLTTGMTLEAWLYPTALSGWRTAILKRTTTGLAYSLYAHNNVPQPATTFNLGGPDLSATGPSALPLNTWSHLAATYNGTTARLYVNGVQVGTLAASGSIITSSGQLSIGGNNVWGEYFSGRIDEVRVYNRALTAAEIQTDMTTAIGSGGGVLMPAMMTADSLAPDIVDTTGSTPPADAGVAPSVSLVNPLSKQTLSGTTLLAAGASDTAGVAGVQFMLDGAALGSELRSAPYALEWDTASVSDGGYVITAVARNTAGAIASSAPVSVVVANGNLWMSPLDTELGLDAINRSGEPTVSATTWPDSQPASAIALKFDLAQVPAGAMVFEATLHMALLETDASAEPSYNVSAHKITGRNPVISRATGYKADGTRPWTPTACCANNVPLAQADISPAYDTQPVDTRHGDKVWSVTPIVQEWLGAPAGNRGMLLNPDLGARANRYRRFASSEHPNANLRPYLQVRYTRTLAADAIPPAVALTGPAAGQTVAGAIGLIAAAGDNAAMAGVQFKVDGVPIGAERTAAPYSVIWDTTRVADGPHVIIAIARDAAGNLAVSEPVTVVVKNVVGLVR